MLKTEEKTRNGTLAECLGNPPERGSVDIFWLGQAGFAIHSADGLVVVDPYLSDSLAVKYRDAHFKHERMTPPPIEPDELRGVDLLLASHAHSDHLDPGGVGTIMVRNPGCVLACPIRIVPVALERGAAPERTIGLKNFEKRRFGEVAVELLPSAHEERDDDGDGNSLFAGFVIETAGVRLYHSGDCVPFSGLSALLRERNIDIALLPVNGRDAERRARGILGNFTLAEAADLCLDAGIPFLIPHHFGMFDFNTVSPEAVRAGLEPYGRRGLGWHVPAPASFLCVVKKKEVK